LRATNSDKPLCIKNLSEQWIFYWYFTLYSLHIRGFSLAKWKVRYSIYEAGISGDISGGYCGFREICVVSKASVVYKSESEKNFSDVRSTLMSEIRIRLLAAFRSYIVLFVRYVVNLKLIRFLIKYRYLVEERFRIPRIPNLTVTIFKADI